MRVITPTVNLANLTPNYIFGTKPNIQDNSTVNEQLKIRPNIPLDDGETPTLSFIMFGNKGHAQKTIDGSITKPYNVEHDPLKPFLRGPIPIAARLLNDDFPPEIRAKLCLRNVVEIDGERVALYYGLRLDKPTTPASTYVVTYKDGEIVNKDNVSLNPSDMKPTIPENIESTDIAQALINGTVVGSTLQADIHVSSFWMNELMNVYSVLYGDASLAFFSEYAFCSAVDRLYDVEGMGGESFSFKEVVAAQALYLVSSYNNVESENDYATVGIDIGTDAVLPTLG